MEASNKSPFKAKKICQLGVVVKDLDKVVEDWSTQFGFGPWSFVDLPTVKVASVFVGPLQFELMQPVEGQPLNDEIESGSPNGKVGELFIDYLDRWGDGVHHVAFCVDDVDKEVSNLESQGVQAIARQKGAWAYMESGGPGSMVFELMPRSSYDLIKEKGVDGFVEERMKSFRADRSR